MSQKPIKNLLNNLLLLVGLNNQPKSYELKANQTLIHQAHYKLKKLAYL